MEKRVVLDHEKLDVYQRALDLVEAADRFAARFGGVRTHLGWQLHKAASSVVLNIAEANGRVSGKDRAYLQVVALGSALECAAVMDVAERLTIGTPVERTQVRDPAVDVVRMLTVLSRNTRRRP